MKTRKHLNKNLIKYNYAKKKVHLCRLYVLLTVLCGMVLLCGCGTEQSSAGIIMELSSESIPDAENDKKIQTDAEASNPPAGNTAEASEKDTEIRNIETGNAEAEDTQTVYIYICGAVTSPGVYQLTQGSRLYEAVEMAGGLTEAADATCLNLARQVLDGEQIVILTCEETDRLKQEGKYTLGEVNTGIAADASSGLVNINTASVSELTTVSGIGESRAQAIIAYREKNGGFRCIEDIKKVEGIKDGLFSKIKDKITV